MRKHHTLALLLCVPLICVAATAPATKTAIKAATKATKPAGKYTQETIISGIKGMTCQFCVYGVKKKLSNLPNVQRAQVSLKRRKGRITYKPGKEANVKAVEAAIKDAGYTVGKIEVVTKSKKKR
jgi:mercuric ion binding protein